MLAAPVPLLRMVPILLHGATRSLVGVHKLDGLGVMTMGALKVPLQPSPDDAPGGVLPHRTGVILGRL